MKDAKSSPLHQPRVEFDVDTHLVDAETDACYAWLQRRYRDLAPDTRTNVLEQQIGNDVKVCSAARWHRFAFPSDPYAPLRTNFNNESTNGQSVKAVVTENKMRADTNDRSDDSAAPHRWKVRLVNSGEVTRRARGDRTSPGLPTLPVVEPSRHVWETLRTTPVVHDVRRPALGGYVQSTQPDSLRFVVFPQAHHDALNDRPGDTREAVRARRAATLQRVPFYTRGTAHLDRNVLTPLSAKDKFDGSFVARFLSASQVHLFAAFALPRREMRKGLLGSSLWRNVDAVDVELYGHSVQTERRYAPSKNKVERCTLVRHGIAVNTSRPDPRYGLRWEASVGSVKGSGHQRKRAAESSGAPTLDAHDDTILSLSAMDTYQSVSQRWRLTTPAFFSRHAETDADPSPTTTTVTSGFQWAAGPGVEITPADKCATLFGKLTSESWLDIPLVSRFSLKLRQQSAVVQPFVPTPPVDDEETAPHTDAVSAEWLRPHRYFWATQGPKWNPKLVRGFDNDYSSLHHAQRWYVLLSAEISRKKRKNKARGNAAKMDVPDDADDEAPRGGFFSDIGATAFANACFADSLKAAPRASVGFSLQSELPRPTVDAFNKLIPSTFECAFSWFVAVKEKTLMTGLRPGVPDDQQFMRVSPVETFRHMKCGLTWNF